MPTTLLAQTYPERPVRMIVPFAPGGTTDFLARIIQPKMQELLGQPVVIENRAGAAGNVGMELASRAAPDGYTLFMGDVGTIAINATIFKDQRVDPIKDFSAISIIADTPSLLVTGPKFPPNSIAELIAYLKERPGQVSFASQGSGSLNRLVMELFAEKAGVKVNHVPYKGGSGPAAADIMGGHIPFMFATIASTITHVRAGRMKTLGVTTKVRHPALPDLPTLAESGFPDLVVSSWQGLFVPAGTPRPVVDRLHDVVAKVMADADVKARIAEGGSLAMSSASPAEAARFAASEATRWSAVAKAVNATAD
ncbi:MAG: tripartite tricarboxylate transporter substrate binding protein [Rhizobiales bacterium]|nr:tripartite tricarboxylate transporter substrate binding protein [Hyphomicrobiales bacterium]